MQKFRFLNYGFVKDAQSRGFHLQYLFSACNRHFIVQTSIEFRLRDKLTDYCYGVFFIRHFKSYRDWGNYNYANY